MAPLPPSAREKRRWGLLSPYRVIQEPMPAGSMSTTSPSVIALALPGVRGYGRGKDAAIFSVAKPPLSALVHERCGQLDGREAASVEFGNQLLHRLDAALEHGGKCQKPIDVMCVAAADAAQPIPSHDGAGLRVLRLSIGAVELLDDLDARHPFLLALKRPSIE